MAFNIPQVDLAQFIHGDEGQRTEFVKQLGQAFEEVGFVSVINHGIPQPLIDELYGNVKSFFALPTEEKLNCVMPGTAGQRGYTSFGQEKAKQAVVADLKEFYQYGQTVAEGSPLAEEYPPNVPVPSMPEFNDMMLRVYRSFEYSGSHLLRAIALHLGLSETYFEDKIAEGNSILRSIHYPPITSEPVNAIRAEQHEDINLITLLVGASAEGLQLLNKQGEWLNISAGPGEIVVNVGDMLQRLTNNKLRSTTHRVVNPPRDMWHTSRFSIPFFLHPKSSMDLTCLPNCIDADHPIAYEPITAGEYLDERLREIGLKK